MDTFDALIALHEAERRVFKHMIDMGMDAKLAKNVMAFLMWLESEGGLKDIVNKISCHSHKVLALVGIEAETALTLLQRDASAPSASSIRLPVTLNLANPAPGSFSLDNVFEDKERVSTGISHILNGVCGMIFKDILEDRSKGKVKEGNCPVAMTEIVQKWVEPVEEGRRVVLEEEKKSRLVPSGSQLNPYAKEWHVSPEEDRCLYVTFSNGFPLSEFQILSFFTMRYGACVERIYVHNRLDGPALFGKIVFRTTTVPAIILNGRDQVKFSIGDRTMWCKRFRPKNKNYN